MAKWKAGRFAATALLASASVCAQPGPEYRLPGGGDDLVRVLYLKNTSTPQACQEIATVVRTVANIKRLFVFQPGKALTVRASADQMKLAEWLIRELDRPPGGTSARGVAAPEYRLATGPDDVVRVLYLAHARSPQAMQELATVVRSLADIKYLFTYHQPGAITLRASEDQVKLAEWLVRELDKPAEP